MRYIILFLLVVLPSTAKANAISTVEVAFHDFVNLFNHSHNGKGHGNSHNSHNQSFDYPSYRPNNCGYNDEMPHQVPEPATVLLMGLGIGSVIVYRNRSKNASHA